MKNKMTKKISCPDCKKKEAHIILLFKRGIAHLRCTLCDSINAFVVTTSDKETDDDDEDDSTGKIGAAADHVTLMEKRKKKCDSYSVSTDYAAGDYLNHKKFGDGYVLAVLVSNKMTVLFSDQQRLLRCGPNSKSEKIIQFGETSSPYNQPESQDAEVVKKKERVVVATSSSGAKDAPVKCPKCGKVVHPYNLSKNPAGRIVGCMNCNNQ